MLAIALAASDSTSVEQRTIPSLYLDAVRPDFYILAMTIRLMELKDGRDSELPRTKQTSHAPPFDDEEIDEKR